MMTKRETAESQTAKDLAKSVEHLLTDIHDESLDRSRLGTETVSRTTARFASLLIILARQAEHESKKIRNLTWALFGLTLVIAILTGCMIWQQAAQNCTP